MRVLLYHTRDVISSGISRLREDTNDAGLIIALDIMMVLEEEEYH